MVVVGRAQPPHPQPNPPPPPPPAPTAPPPASPPPPQGLADSWGAVASGPVVVAPPPPPPPPPPRALASSTAPFAAHAPVRGAHGARAPGYSSQRQRGARGGGVCDALTISSRCFRGKRGGSTDAHVPQCSGMSTAPTRPPGVRAFWRWRRQSGTTGRQLGRATPHCHGHGTKPFHGA